MQIKRTKKSEGKTVKNQHIGEIKVSYAKIEDFNQNKKELDANIEIVLDNGNEFTRLTGIKQPLLMNEYLSKYFLPYLGFMCWRQSKFDDFKFTSEIITGIENSKKYSLENIIIILNQHFSLDVLNNLFLREEEGLFVEILKKFIVPNLKKDADSLYVNEDYLIGLEIGIYFSYKKWQQLFLK